MAFTGQTSEEMLGTGWGNAVHPDDVTDAFQQWASSVRQRVPFQIEYRVRRFDGEWRWMSVHAVPVLDEAGEVLEWLGMNLDITERKQLEEVLVRRTNRLQSLFDTAHDAILMLDHEGRILYANPASERLLGCSQEELLGRNISTLVFTDGRGSSEHGIQWKKFFDEEGQAFREIRDLYAKGCQGNIFRVELVAGGTGPDRQSACFLRDVTERNDLQRHVLNVAAEEQRRLAYELHDGVQQELVGLSLLANSLCSYLEEFEDLRRQVRGQGVGGNGTSDDSQGFSAKDLAERLSLGLMGTQRNLRELVHGMVPSLHDPDALRVALESLVERVRTKVSCDFDCSAEFLVADGDVSFQVYRIVQEAFTNALRHSGAKTLSLSLKGVEDDLVVEVSDDGVGADLSQANSGMGLRTMRYRINMIGGALAIENRPGGGTTVRCVFPRDRASSDGRVPQ
jgi:PAS domain S-box-containing protein